MPQISNAAYHVLVNFSKAYQDRATRNVSLAQHSLDGNFLE